jgi:Calcineurin-like phosphoesterase
MKIRILSDLHLEFQDWVPPNSDADIVVLAGDIHVGAHGIDWARRSFPLTPVIYVPGNHEFYGGNLQSVTDELYTRAKRFGVDVLDGRRVVIGGVRFLGATLWTDFALYGSDQRSINRAMTAAQNDMNDFHVIRHKNGKFGPVDARDINLERVRWLRTELAEDFQGTTIVVTHHLPLPQSIHPKYSASSLNPSFASDLSSLMGPPVSLWILRLLDRTYALTGDTAKQIDIRRNAYQRTPGISTYRALAELLPAGRASGSADPCMH